MQIKLDKGKWVKRLALTGIVTFIFLISSIITPALILDHFGELSNQKIVVASILFMVAVFNGILFINTLRLKKFDSIIMLENGFFVDNARMLNRGNKIAVEDIEEITSYNMRPYSLYSGIKEEFKIKLKGGAQLSSISRQLKKKDLYISDAFVSTEELIRVIEKLKTEANKS